MFAWGSSQLLWEGNWGEGAERSCGQVGRWSNNPHFTCVWVPVSGLPQATSSLPVTLTWGQKNQPATSLSQLPPSSPPRPSQAAGPLSLSASWSLPLDTRLRLRPGPCPFQGLKQGRALGDPCSSTNTPAEVCTLESGPNTGWSSESNCFPPCKSFWSHLCTTVHRAAFPWPGSECPPRVVPRNLA